MSEQKEVNPKDATFLAIEASLLRQMTLTLFGTLVSMQPDPLKFYETFLIEWESIVSEAVQRDIREIEKTLKAHNISDTPMSKALYRMAGIDIPDPNDLIEQSTKAIDHIKAAYLKPIHDKYKDK